MEGGLPTSVAPIASASVRTSLENIIHLSKMALEAAGQRPDGRYAAFSETHPCLVAEERVIGGPDRKYTHSDRHYAVSREKSSRPHSARAVTLSQHRHALRKRREISVPR